MVFTRVVCTSVVAFGLAACFIDNPDPAVTRDLDMIGRFEFLDRTGNVLTTSELKARSAVVRYTLGTAYTLERGYRVKLSGDTYASPTRARPATAWR